MPFRGLQSWAGQKMALGKARNIGTKSNTGGAYLFANRQRRSNTMQAMALRTSPNPPSHTWSPPVDGAHRHAVRDACVEHGHARLIGTLAAGAQHAANHHIANSLQLSHGCVQAVRSENLMAFSADGIKGGTCMPGVIVSCFRSVLSPLAYTPNHVPSMHYAFHVPTRSSGQRLKL